MQAAIPDAETIGSLGRDLLPLVCVSTFLPQSLLESYDANTDGKEGDHAYLPRS